VAPWTLSELTNEAARHLAQLPAQRNGQIRAVPDERTIRYYAALGLLDRPEAMRGRTALYGARHVAQIVAIKRLQLGGRSLAEIQAMWSTIDNSTLERMSGVSLPAGAPRTARAGFWQAAPTAPTPADEPARVLRSELRIELAPDVFLTLAGDLGELTPADAPALRAAATPLLDELARRTTKGPRP
jgi:DNA-binding transcriptional MerR regulator